VEASPSQANATDRANHWDFAAHSTAGYFWNQKWEGALNIGKSVLISVLSPPRNQRRNPRQPAGGTLVTEKGQDLRFMCGSDPFFG
jgi:hypothetical protein